MFGLIRNVRGAVHEDIRVTEEPSRGIQANIIYQYAGFACVEVTKQTALCLVSSMSRSVVAQFIAACSLDEANIRALITKQPATITRTHPVTKFDYLTGGKRKLSSSAFFH